MGIVTPSVSACLSTTGSHSTRYTNQYPTLNKMNAKGNRNLDTRSILRAFSRFFDGLKENPSRGSGEFCFVGEF